MQVIQRTHQGLVRKDNQDALLVDGHVFGVADGMGGHRGGKTASTVTAGVLTSFLRGKPPTPDTLRLAVEAANRRVYAMAQDDESLSGMGTTLTMLWEDASSLLIAHVGDSRAYRLRDGVLKQMTDDHSMVAEMVRNHIITADMARNHPMRNIITRAVGIDATVYPDIFAHEKRVGDLWLLCSDGLYDMVADEEILATLTAHDDEAAAGKLLSLALEHGGADNVSFVLCRVTEVPQP